MKENRFKKEFISELNIGKAEFTEKFSEKFEQSNIDFFSEFSKSLNLSKINKSLIGKLKNNSFEVKRNSTMNSFNYATATAKGKITESHKGVVIETKISGFDYRFIPLYIILAFVFIISLIGIFTDFSFIMGVIFSSGIFLYTRNNMLRDVKNLNLELTKIFKTISE